MKTAETGALAILAVVVVAGGIALGLALWALAQAGLGLLAWIILSL